MNKNATIRLINDVYIDKILSVPRDERVLKTFSDYQIECRLKLLKKINKKNVTNKLTVTE